MAMLLTGALLITFCQQKPAGSGNDGGTEYDFSIRFQPTPPKELAADADPVQLATFAWEEFFALNWESDYPNSGKRDFPNYSWNYQADQSPYPQLVVWETYAHRTELRPASNNMGPFDKAPRYSFKIMPAIAPGASFTLFNNLDENNEIGSCDVYAHVGKYDKKYMVLYQAKANRDEYDYLLNNYPTFDKLLSATSNTLRNINQYSAYYPGATSTCNCPPEQNVLCLPCGGAPVPGTNDSTYTGAMEVKTAWRELAPEDDSTRYFRRTVIVYEKAGNTLVAVNKTYALIGLHIIHKTQNYPNFIFATFEQVDVEQSDMGYVELDNKGNETGPVYPKYPRLHPIPDVINASTEAAHKALKDQNPNSIWQYYRLVGVQSTPTNDTSSFSFFLANYVIESDSTLADFHGSGIGTPHNAGNNNLYKGQYYSMGGCQGCHGVAQLTLGGDCSFLMDTVGKPVTSPDPGLEIGKLQRYITALQRNRMMLEMEKQKQNK